MYLLDASDHRVYSHGDPPMPLGVYDPTAAAVSFARSTTAVEVGVAPDSRLVRVRVGVGVRNRNRVGVRAKVRATPS